MTANGSNKEDRKEGAPKLKGRDPRVLAFVRLLARQAADKDYAHLLRTSGKAPQPQAEKE
ncbi:hypothetical protein [Siccirubricoccus phaeus]|uniref:hypothetical protein n=1 Tax=Siccirubricoccus phaeus TaxID=2595053 RepID=UPI0011F124C4|nr:hypothetical protein [Siccirubricoccus phaeus]